jgi:hypothetical protein
VALLPSCRLAVPALPLVSGDTTTSAIPFWNAWRTSGMENEAAAPKTSRNCGNDATGVSRAGAIWVTPTMPRTPDGLGRGGTISRSTCTLTPGITRVAMSVHLSAECAARSSRALERTGRMVSNENERSLRPE